MPQHATQEGPSHTKLPSSEEHARTKKMVKARQRSGSGKGKALNPEASTARRRQDRFNQRQIAQRIVDERLIPDSLAHKVASLMLGTFRAKGSEKFACSRAYNKIVRQLTDEEIRRAGAITLGKTTATTAMQEAEQAVKSTVPAPRQATAPVKDTISAIV